MFKRLTAAALLVITITATSYSQPLTSKASLGTASQAAFAYFETVQNQTFDDYLTHERPGKLAPELKVRVLAMLRKEDLVTPSSTGSKKLSALEPVFKYHDRSTVIDVKVIRLGKPVVMLLAGAAVLISQEALAMLTAEELQAVVAHELGHEYFWNEYERARELKQVEKLREFELRCDGLAVITMAGVGIDPEHLINAITKLTKAHTGQSTRADYYVSLTERINFNRAMIELVNARNATQIRLRNPGVVTR